MQDALQDGKGAGSDAGIPFERHGRSGVPLYLYYAPGRDAEILPQILTVSRLTGLR